MPSFEDLFRYSWQFQFKRDFESTLGLKKVPQCDLSTSHFNMDVDSMLKQFRQHIRAEGERNNIDARAIAGAIAWEYKQNWTGRYSDYLQFKGTDRSGLYTWGDTHSSGNAGLGWGSVHTPRARELRPGASAAELDCLRMKADTAISLVADIMGENARTYYKLSEGAWIGDLPPVSAFFFNVSAKTLKASAERVKNDPHRDTRGVTITVSADQNWRQNTGIQVPMGKWVLDHLDDFKDFKTRSRPPGTRRVHITVK